MLKNKELEQAKELRIAGYKVIIAKEDGYMYSLTIQEISYLLTVLGLKNYKLELENFSKRIFKKA